MEARRSGRLKNECRGKGRKARSERARTVGKEHGGKARLFYLEKTAGVCCHGPASKLSEASCAFETAWLPAASRSALFPIDEADPQAGGSGLPGLRSVRVNWVAGAVIGPEVR